MTLPLTIIFCFLLALGVHAQSMIVTISDTNVWVLQKTTMLNPPVWSVLAYISGTNSIHIEDSLLNTFTNPITQWKQSFSWNSSTNPLVIGSYMYLNGSQIDEGTNLNATVYFNNSGTNTVSVCYYESNCWANRLATLTATGTAVIPPITVFMRAQQAYGTRPILSIAKGL